MPVAVMLPGAALKPGMSSSSEVVETEYMAATKLSGRPTSCTWRPM
jgi:hypothetical protein